MMLPSLALADMAGFNVGFGENSKPFYGVDHEFNEDGHLPYLDMALYGNSDFVQPYLSLGLQFEHLNIGVAAACTLSNISNGAFNGQLAVGPEVGYMQNLSKLLYVKGASSYLGYNSAYSLSTTLSLGVNF